MMELEVELILAFAFASVLLIACERILHNREPHP